MLLAGPAAGADPARLQADVVSALAAAGAAPVVRIRVVDAIPAGAAGKRPLVVARASGATVAVPDE